MERQSPLSSAQWSSIETILLDMDGTLLDLAFDNHFWLELVPKVYAEKHQLSPENAHHFLTNFYQKYYGTLEWYCIDFWSQKLELDIAKLKQQEATKIAYRCGTVDFLEKAKQQNKKLYLVTNAHPQTLTIKLQQKNFSAYFEELLSSHQTGFPKEELKFWQTIEKQWRFDKNTTLFVDDSVTILRQAKVFGIAHVLGVSHPDSTKAPLAFDEFTSVNQLDQILTF